MYQGTENGNDRDKPLSTVLLCFHFLHVIVRQIILIFWTNFSLYTAHQNLANRISSCTLLKRLT